jgi:proline iminopeptidase
MGYAGAQAEWRCPDPTTGVVLRERGGFIGRPDGTRLLYRDIGSGTVNLIAAGATVLTDFLRPLTEQQRVVLYDPRHQGGSRPVSDTAGVGIEAEVDDLAAVRQHFAAENVALLGWSHMGASVARYAALRPDLVTRVVLVGPIPPRRASYQVDWARGAGQDSLGLELLRIMRARGENQAHPIEFCRRYWEIAVLRPWMGDPAAVERSTMDPCRFENEQPDRREANLARLFEAFGDWDWTRNVGDFAGPVLVVHGTADPVPIEGAAEWIESFPNARLLSIEGAGHLPWLEQPEVVREAIRTFLEGTWPERAVGR